MHSMYSSAPIKPKSKRFTSKLRWILTRLWPSNNRGPLLLLLTKVWKWTLLQERFGNWSWATPKDLGWSDHCHNRPGTGGRGVEERAHPHEEASWAGRISQELPVTSTALNLHISGDSIATEETTIWMPVLLSFNLNNHKEAYKYLILPTSRLSTQMSNTAAKI